MANFKYRARSVDGEVVNGVVEALNKYDAAAEIRKDCPIIEELVEVKEKGSAKDVQLGQIKVKTLSMLCNRFSTILQVGLPIVRAVEMLSDQMEDDVLKRVLKEVASEISMGQSLSECFFEKKGYFPVTFLESIRAGEESGTLEETFAKLSSFYEKSYKTRQKVTSAMMYPAAVIVVAVGVMAVIMTKGIPTFAKSFESMNMELPAVTKFVIGMSNLFTDYGIHMLFVVAAIIFTLKIYKRTEKGAVKLSTFTLKIPVIGNIIKLSTASQFAHTMSMMLSAGMPILSCIEISGKSISNFVMKRDVLASMAGVEEGKTLGSCLESSAVLPNMLIEMIKMGETTGTLENTLESLGNFYDNEVDVGTAKALTLLEPAIICVLAVFVVIILLSVYLPMFGMYGAM